MRSRSSSWPSSSRSSSRSSASAAARRSALGAADVSGYSALMTATVSPVADELLDAVPLGGRRALLDVGGGEGAFVLAAARRHPQLACTLFDLPAVVERARARLEGRG